MRKHRAGSVWMILPLYLFTLIFVALPLLYVVALSFSTADGGYGVNWKFTLDNYKQILEPVYLQTFTGSFRLALTSTLIICLVGYPFGYFMAKLSEGKKKLAMLFLMLPFWVNSLIRLYGWIIILQKKGLLNYLLMKLGIIQEPLKILYSYPAIVIGMIYVLLPFMALSVYSSAEKLDWSLVEAARIDGSGDFHTFNRIVLPIMKPAIAVQAIFTFVGSWNNYFVPALVIQSKNKMTVPILIATLRGADYMNFDMGKIYMMITVAIVPIIIVYLLLSKYIIAGVTLGGVKE